MNTLPTTPEPARPNPASPDDAAAFLLTLIMGDPNLTLAQALEAQRQRIAALRDPTSPKALEELARQLPILESLFFRLSADALREKRADRRAVLLRAALNAQQAHARTFALVRGLALQGKGQGAVTLEPGPDLDSDSEAGADLDGSSASASNSDEGDDVDRGGLA